MVKILNHVHKFKDDKAKLISLCIAYIQMIEKLTDLERLQDDTIEERRVIYLLEP